jgi:hypothetical protein
MIAWFPTQTVGLRVEMLRNRRIPRLNRSTRTAAGQILTILVAKVVFLAAAGCVSFHPPLSIDPNEVPSCDSGPAFGQKFGPTMGPTMGPTVGVASWRSSISLAEDSESGGLEGCSGPYLHDSLEQLSGKLHCGIIVPAVPVPGFWVRWKERRDLPKGPEGARFQPLPTRPMFVPRPESAEREVLRSLQRLNEDNCTYGQLPRTAQWQASDRMSAPLEIPDPVDIPDRVSFSR